MKFFIKNSPVPTDMRSRFTVIGILIIVGIYSIIFDGIYLPSRNGGVFFHDNSLKVFYVSLLLGVTSQIIYVIDMKRLSNSLFYKLKTIWVAKIIESLAWLFLGFAIYLYHVKNI